ncbi:MAG: hypothetical protein ACKV2O_22385 [Acidimicrobiales bacterium]
MPWAIPAWSGSPDDFGRVVAEVERVAHEGLTTALGSGGITHDEDGYQYRRLQYDHGLKVEVSLRGRVTIVGASWDEVMGHPEMDLDRVTGVTIRYGLSRMTGQSVELSLDRRGHGRLFVDGNTTWVRQVSHELQYLLAQRRPWWGFVRGPWGMAAFLALVALLWAAWAVPFSLRNSDWSVAVASLGWTFGPAVSLWSSARMRFAPGLEILPEGRLSSRGRAFVSLVGLTVVGLLTELAAAAILA